MATRKRKVEPGNCGICGVTLGTPHAGNCPLGAPAVPPGENGVPANPPPPSDGPLFDIHDLAAVESERPAPVVIDGQPYQWARWGNFGLRVRHEVASLAQTAQRLEQLPAEQVTDEDDRTHEAAVLRLLDLALPALTPEHRAMLDRRQREGIVAAFLIEFAASTSLSETTSERIAMRLTGARSSPPSGASTAALSRSG